MKQPFTTLIRTLWERPITFSNVASQGTHEGGCLTVKAVEPIGMRYVFGSLDADGKYVSVASLGKTDHARAVGIITDEADAADDFINLQVLGAGSSTLVVVAGSDIEAGQLLTSNADGKAVPVNAQEAGTYFVYGIALRSAHEQELVEITPVVGVEKTIS